MEMQHLATNSKFLILVGIVMGLMTTTSLAEELQIVKSEDVYQVPDDHDKQSSKDIYAVDGESILEDGRLYLQVNMASYHPSESDDEDYNEFNPGLGLEYHFEHYFITGGFFQNSIDKISTYFGAGAERNILTEWFGLGVLGGVVTGYDDDNGFSPRLAAIPYAYLQSGRTTIKAHYVPAVGDVDDDAIGFAVRFDLGGIF